MSPHLFVDISSHGFGHLAQTAPVLNALRHALPDLQLTVRCGLPKARLRERIRGGFDHLPEASDFGFEMRDAMRIDAPATARRYRALHADWDRQVDTEAQQLVARAPDFVLSNVAYLPLAGAARAGIPAAAMCSLNWGDLFAHYFVGLDTDATTDGAMDAGSARRINVQISAAYAAQPFLALSPAMPMPGHPDCRVMPSVAEPGQARRDVLLARVGAGPAARRIVLVAFGGIPMHLPVERWAQADDVLWLVPQSWPVATGHPAFRAIESCGLAFSDVLASVDAVVTKPGYGTFVEAAACATPVLYLPREDWPEQECLIAWLHRHGRARALSAQALADHAIAAELDALWAMPPVPTGQGPDLRGAAQVAAWLAECLVESLCRR